MVLKGVNWLHNDKIKSNGHVNELIGYTMIKWGSNGFERNQ